MTFVLASRSSIRIKLLRDAGLVFDAVAADLDEDAIGRDTPNPADRALLLAIAKARHVSAQYPGRVVLGADQVALLDDGSFLEKPRSPAHHVDMLLSMAGRTHAFHPAAALVRDGTLLQEITDVVRVTFRRFDERTARAYVATGEGAGSCGGYECENRGVQLIERVEGSMHAVLGLPLLGVLAALRREGPSAFL